MLKTNEMMGACVARRRAWSCGALAVALAGSLALAGCTGGTFEEAAEGAGEKTGAGTERPGPGATTAQRARRVKWTGASLIDIPGMDFAYSDRDKDASYDVASATNIALSGQGATVSGEGAAVEGATVTISAAGTYAVTGELTAGSLVVNAGDQDKVQIVLSGASIRNEAGPALNIQQADKVFVTLADGTQNTLADGASYELVEGEDEPNAALYSKADLTINGTGALSVEGNYRHGVNSKDDLVVTGGAITVVAKEDGLRGKDCVKVADGSFAITAGGDGVKSSNDEDPTRGFVSIDGGTFTVTGCEEGIEAQEVIVNNGELNITAVG
ncbi:MAG: carbohydrate-binding domain-containing protein [Adlercreutzia equolifaciens]